MQSPVPFGAHAHIALGQPHILNTHTSYTHIATLHTLCQCLNIPAASPPHTQAPHFSSLCKTYSPLTTFNDLIRSTYIHTHDSYTTFRSSPSSSPSSSPFLLLFHFSFSFFHFFLSFFLFPPPPLSPPLLLIYLCIYVCICVFISLFSVSTLSLSLDTPEEGTGSHYRWL